MSDSALKDFANDPINLPIHKLSISEKLVMWYLKKAAQCGEYLHYHLLGESVYYCKTAYNYLLSADNQPELLAEYNFFIQRTANLWKLIKDIMQSHYDNAQNTYQNDMKPILEIVNLLENPVEFPNWITEMQTELRNRTDEMFIAFNMEAIELSKRIEVANNEEEIKCSTGLFWYYPQDNMRFEFNPEAVPPILNVFTINNLNYKKINQEAIDNLENAFKLMVNNAQFFSEESITKLNALIFLLNTDDFARYDSNAGVLGRSTNQFKPAANESSPNISGCSNNSGNNSSTSTDSNNIQENISNNTLPVNISAENERFLNTVIEYYNYKINDRVMLETVFIPGLFQYPLLNSCLSVSIFNPEDFETELQKTEDDEGFYILACVRDSIYNNGFLKAEKQGYKAGPRYNLFNFRKRMYEPWVEYNINHNKKKIHPDYLYSLFYSSFVDYEQWNVSRILVKFNDNIIFAPSDTATILKVEWEAIEKIINFESDQMNLD